MGLKIFNLFKIRKKVVPGDLRYVAYNVIQNINNVFFYSEEMCDPKAL